MRTLFASISLVLVISHSFAQYDCNSAVAIQATTYVISAIDGTQAPIPICTGGEVATAGEWYAYTPAWDNALTITTDLPVNAGKDTRFHVFIGACANLTCVGGDDDSGSGLLSEVTFNVTAGTTYLIAFDNRWQSTGFTFRLTEMEPVVSSLSFTQQTFPVTGMFKCVVDMNGDHLDDAVKVSSASITALVQQPGGGFETQIIPTEQAAHTPSWSIAAGDIDGNGYTDLLYGGGSGTAFMLANSTGTGFTQFSGPEYVFSQRTNFIDINNDGHLDAFVCHDVQPNVYYIGDGTGTLTFNQGGLGDTPDGGNYGSLWVDYDNDGDVDLFLSKCRGGNTPANINQMHRNNGDGTYTEVAESLGLADNIQTWSSAWGDLDNDGDMDIMVGAFSFVNGSHKLIRNDGNGVFVDVTDGSGFDTFTTTSIEHITHDFNNDGYLDIMSGGGVIMMNNGDFTFSPTAVPMNNGPVGDLNNDGFLDIVNNNVLYVNDGNNNNWLKVNTIGTTSNYNGIGARITITSAMGSQIREVRSGDGFGFMSTLNAHFGIGEDTQIDEVIIRWPSGTIDTLTQVPANSTISVTEGSTGSPTGIADHTLINFELYPNPAEDLLYLRPGVEMSDRPVNIFDMGGRLVKRTMLTNGSIAVQELKSGMYMLTFFLDDGHQLKRKFSKR